MGLIYLDTCIVIYVYEDDGIHTGRVRSLLSNDHEHEFAISPLVKMECLVGPLKSSNLMLQRTYEIGFGRFVQLPMDEGVYIMAAELRARFGLNTPDALHLATAQMHKCEAFWTNDNRLAVASRELAIDVIE